MGFALGMMSGATTTNMLIMGNIVGHGGVTAELIQQMEALLHSVVCTSCPSASEGASISYGTDCVQYLNESRGETTPSLPFCSGYDAGFKCAVSVILSNLRGDTAYAEERVTVTSGFTNVCE